jgi:hypothetical protein
MKGARTLVKTIFLDVKGSSDSGSWVLKLSIVPFFKMLFLFVNSKGRGRNSLVANRGGR